MQKWSPLLIIPAICFREKSSFPKRLDVRFYYESQSKTHARDGSPTNNEIPKKENIEKKTLPKKLSKRGAIMMKKHTKNDPKKELNSTEKLQKNGCEKKVEKKSAKAQSGTLPWVPGDIQFNKIESYLSKEKPLERKTSEKKNL